LLASSLGRRGRHWPLLQLLRNGGLKSCHATAGNAEREDQAAGQKAQQRRVRLCTRGRGLPFAQAERQRHATRARAEVRGTFSQPGPWRHTVVARLAPTLGLTIHAVRCASKVNASRGELSHRERPVRPATTHSTVGPSRVVVRNRDSVNRRQVAAGRQFHDAQRQLLGATLLNRSTALRRQL
jgi:hypothetical protein